MNTAMLMIAIFAGPPSVPEAWVDAVAHVETGGHKDPDNAVGDGTRAKGRFQFWKEAWSDCSKVRSKYKLPVYPYSKATDPAIALEYARTWLGVMRRVVTRHTGRPATLAETWSCYNRGITGFQRLGYDVSRMPDHAKNKINYLNTIK
jgi:hypothetical protein